MINFSKISNRGMIGKFLRYFVRLLPKNAVMPIMQGELKGTKWVVGSGVAGYWLGSYELAEQKKIKEYLSAGDTFYDIGAHCGFYSLLAGMLVGESGLVIAFEPLPRNILYFRRNIELNKIKNIKLIETAIGDASGEAKFSEAESTSEGKLSESGSLTVKIERIDDLISSGECLPPNFMKIDVEGKLKEVILGALETIKKHKPKLIFEGEYKIDKEIFEILEKIGYKISPIDAKSLETSTNFLAIAT